MIASSPDWFTILGSGTGIVTPRRAAPAVLIGSEKFLVLVDCGPGCLLRLSQTGLDVTKIAAVLFSHFHVDHCADLAPLLFARRVPELPRAEQPLVLAGLGMASHYAALQGLHGQWVEPLEGSPTLIELQEACFDLGPWQIEWTRTTHTPSSVAYRFEASSGHSLVISGDTGPSIALEQLARDVDTLVLECAFPDPSPYPTHLSPATAGELATAAGCKRLVLTHFYPKIESSDILRGIGKSYRGPVILAEDLLTLGW